MHVCFNWFLFTPGQTQPTQPCYDLGCFIKALGQAPFQATSIPKHIAGWVGGQNKKALMGAARACTTSNAGEASTEQRSGIALPSPSLHNRAQGCGGTTVAARADNFEILLTRGAPTIDSCPCILIASIGQAHQSKWSKHKDTTA